MVRGRPGPAPQTAKREFTRLISRGVSNAEACRIVGVNPRTGKRWRHGRAITSSSGRRLHYPPVIVRKREISARYLSEEERIVIADLCRRGCTVRAIAVAVHRNPSTISRELRRNRDPGTGAYRPFTAQRRAADRRARPGRGKLVGDRVLRRFVAERLRTRWSPDRSARRCARSSPTSRSATWCRRPSTRRSTARTWAGCTDSCRGRLRTGDAVGSRTSVRTPVTPVAWWT